MSPSDSSRTPPLPRTARRTIGVVFVALFIDLAGFSIIFPLFPAMLTHYQAIEPQTSLFGSFYSLVLDLARLAGPEGENWGVIVLFGGVLGSLFSLLQFAFAPILGTLSDRYGRRPVLLISLTGIFVSYLLWAVAGRFWVLVLSRILGGIMSANIATATAVVADTTTRETRSKGTALIGMAFGLGFLLGPALGGGAALLNPLDYAPGLAAWGVNPFTMPALAAALLTAGNIVLVARWLPETRPAVVEGATVQRTANPLRLLRMRFYTGVGQTNLTYFLYILAFSGMEFTLTFLAVDRLGYSPFQNAMMLVFVGLVMAVAQGAYVRWASVRFGAKNVAIHGLLTTLPGLLCIGLTAQWQHPGVLYLGLFLLGLGIAQATPCLTALVSVYTPADDQGRVLGVFRSLGALARGIGPLAGAILYWQFGAAPTYYAGTLLVLLPLAMALTLPTPDYDTAPPEPVTE